MSTFYIDPNIAKASTILTDVYTSDGIFEAAKEKIFAPSWQFIGSKEMVKFNGDVQPFTLLENYMDEPLMLTKDAAGEVHCLSNVCTHRANLIAYKQCSKATNLRCKYHGRLSFANWIKQRHFLWAQHFRCYRTVPYKTVME